jgi:hypothetical protein
MIAASTIAVTASKVAYGLIRHIERNVALDHKMIDVGCNCLYMLAIAAGDHAQLGYHLASVNDAVLDAVECNERLDYDAVQSALFLGSGL